jgi:hypothetical protein
MFTKLVNKNTIKPKKVSSYSQKIFTTPNIFKIFLQKPYGPSPWIFLKCVQLWECVNSLGFASLFLFPCTFLKISCLSLCFCFHAQV